MNGVTIYDLVATEQRLFHEQLAQRSKWRGVASLAGVSPAGGSGFRRMMNRIRHLAFDSRESAVASMNEQPAGC